MRRSVPSATSLVPYQWRSRCAVPPGMPTRSIAIWMTSDTDPACDRLAGLGCVAHEPPATARHRRGGLAEQRVQGQRVGAPAIPADPQGAAFDVDIFAARLGGLVHAQAAESRQQNHDASFQAHAHGQQRAQLLSNNSPVQKPRDLIAAVRQ